jgi:hypothetical protein
VENKVGKPISTPVLGGNPRSSFSNASSRSFTNRERFHGSSNPPSPLIREPISRKDSQPKLPMKYGKSSYPTSVTTSTLQLPTQTPQNDRDHAPHSTNPLSESRIHEQREVGVVAAPGDCLIVKPHPQRYLLKGHSTTLDASFISARERPSATDKLSNICISTNAAAYLTPPESPILVARGGDKPLPPCRTTDVVQAEVGTVTSKLVPPLPQPCSIVHRPRSSQVPPDQPSKAVPTPTHLEQWPFRLVDDTSPPPTPKFSCNLEVPDLTNEITCDSKHSIATGGFSHIMLGTWHGRPNRPKVCPGINIATTDITSDQVAIKTLHPSSDHENPRDKIDRV